MAPFVIIPNFEKINVISANTLETRSPPGVIFVIDSQVYNSSNGFNWKKKTSSLEIIKSRVCTFARIHISNYHKTCAMRKKYF